MSSIVDLPVITRLDSSPDRILTKALEKELKEAVVIGTTQDGDLYFASSIGPGPDVLWLMELAKKELLA